MSKVEQDPSAAVTKQARTPKRLIITNATTPSNNTKTPVKSDKTKTSQVATSNSSDEVTAPDQAKASSSVDVAELEMALSPSVKKAPVAAATRKATTDKGMKYKRTLCLTMIVKNESHIIQRLLDSVVSVIDYICITDTGSTDDTVNIIEQWGKDHNIPTTVCHSEFRSFGYARNMSLANSRNNYPQAGFLLLLDADFVVEPNDFSKDELDFKHHIYKVTQYNLWNSWANIRIVANWIDYEYRMRTHEYIRACAKQSTYQGEIRTKNITSLRIRDRGDGGSKADKFERDQRLLQEEIDDPCVDEHDRTRAYYYQGNSYKNGRKYLAAIPYYQERIARGGWFEEVYLSWHNIGNCYEQLYNDTNEVVKILEQRQQEAVNLQLISDTMSEYLTDDLAATAKEKALADDAGRASEDELIKQYNLTGLTVEEVIKKRDDYFNLAVQHYMKAYFYCRTRAESLYSVVKMFRVRGNKEKDDLRKGLLLALEGSKIPVPEQCTLDVHYGIHQYGFDTEIMILAYYVEGMKHHGQAAKDRLASKLGQMAYPYDVMYERNKRFYQ